MKDTACPRGGAPSGCQGCREMCSRYPGRFTPDEAERAIAEGFGGQLYLTRFGRTSVLRPAIVGWEGLTLRERDMKPGMCVFLAASGACEIHDSGFKPSECQAASCENMRSVTRAEVDATIGEIEAAWRTAKGRDVIRLWTRTVTPLERRRSA